MIIMNDMTVRAVVVITVLVMRINLEIFGSLTLRGM